MAVRLKDRVEANIRQSDKVNSSLSIQLNSGTATVYNGSADKTINITPAAIGAPTTATLNNYLLLSGGTMTGTLTLKKSVYTDAAATGSLNVNNSNIYGVNSLYFADLCDSSGEGIHFYRSATAVDTIWVKNGVIYFEPNRTYGSSATAYTMLHSNNYTSFADNRYLQLTGGTITGTTMMTGHLYISNGDRWPQLHIRSSDVSSDNALIYLDDGLAGGGASVGYFCIRLYSPNSSNKTMGTHYEDYSLPQVDLDRTTTVNYEILTTKDYSKLDNRYLKLSGGQLSGSIHIAHTTSATMDTTTTNPRIIFSENGVQPVALVYTDYNNYRAPHGLKVVGLDGEASWFEVDGPIYANGGVVGNASTATWSYNVAYSAPSTHFTQGISYIMGQRALGTGTDQVHIDGTNGDYKVISASSKTTYDNGTVGNVQIVRFYWGTTYYNELHMSPNYDKLVWCAVQNGTRHAYKQIWMEGDSVTGAVWNDYAEYRESDCREFGRVLVENGDDSLSISNFRLQPFAGVSSDTWGFCQGETEKAKTPIAVAGRVLVYPYQNRNNYKPGDCVCAAPNGTVDIMTRQEVIQYPDRIVGTVSCIPDYEEWGQGDRPAVKVNGRIWIKVR